MVKHLSADRPMVVVAPSMSGSYAVPLVVRRPDLVAGFVPVAPVLPEGQLSAEDKAALAASRVPTMAVYGEWDARGRRITETLLAPMPFATVHVLPEARHAAYVDQPDQFHDLLLQFVSRISAQGSGDVPQPPPVTGGNDDEA
jgi:abhydrolase domain-containing protein 14